VRRRKRALAETKRYVTVRLPSRGARSGRSVGVGCRASRVTTAQHGSTNITRAIELRQAVSTSARCPCGGRHGDMSAFGETATLEGPWIIGWRSGRTRRPVVVDQDVRADVAVGA